MTMTSKKGKVAEVKHARSDLRPRPALRQLCPGRMTRGPQLPIPFKTPDSHKGPYSVLCHCTSDPDGRHYKLEDEQHMHTG